MTVRTANDFLKARVGDLMFEVSNLQSENETLKEKLIELGRMLPPEMLEKAKIKIVGAAPENSESAKNASPPPPPPAPSPEEH